LQVNKKLLKNCIWEGFRCTLLLWVDFSGCQGWFSAY
jgi:hypothetical protein